MKHNTIYKKDTKGKIRVWHMETDGNMYRTIAGLKDGRQITTDWTVVCGKNIGKANQTTPEQQALTEVLSQYKKKLSGEYHENINDIDIAKFFKPMLAQGWDKRKDKIDFSAGVYIQPKLDGIRCIANRDGVWTRTGKPIISIQHIVDYLKPLFEKYPDIVLDGELYNHTLKDDFNDIVSMVKKTNIKNIDVGKTSRMVQYHVYDLPGDDVFSDRICRLESIIAEFNFDQAIQVVKTHYTTTLDHVDMLYGGFISDGYEGGMIRLNTSGYEQKRSNTLIKRKDFEDAEFEIVRIEEGTGNWSGHAKRVFFKNDTCGKTVGAGLSGTKEYTKKVLEESEQYVGKKVTIQFFTRTPNGIPRFPIAKILHKSERW